MRRHPYWALCMIAVGSSVLVSQHATAQDEIPQTAPTALVQQRLRDLPSPGYGMWWDLALPTAPSSFIEFFETDSTGNKSSDSILCSEFQDPSCAPRPNTWMMSVAALGRCINDDEIACIENIRLRTGRADLTQLQFVGYLGPETQFAQSSALSLPRGSSVSRWRDSEGAEYAVIASVTSSLKSSLNNWLLIGQDTIVNVSRLASPACSCPHQFSLSPATIIAPPSMSYKTVGNPNPPTPAIEFKPSTRIELSLRLPNTITGWFNGRVANGTVASRVLSGNRTSYTFTADTASTYIAGGATQASSLPPDFVTNTMGQFSPVGSSWGHTPGTLGMMDKYERWSPFLGDRALVTQSRWTIRGTKWTTNSCFAGGTGISGLLATNASVFDGSPPVWNQTSKTLTFDVASPHYDELGQEASGSYSLSIPAASVACLYGRATLPMYFKIEVGYGSSGQPFSSVSALTESNGWVNFSAQGFHYSKPTISVTFTDDPNGAVQNLTTLVANNQAATNKIPAVYAKTSVRGSKATVLIRLDKTQVVKIYRKIGRKTTLIKTLNARKGSTTFTTSYRKGQSILVRDARGKVVPPLTVSSSRLGALSYF